MKITFLGATRTVTGSKFLLETKGKKILIDCGLFQGDKKLRERNWEPFNLDPTKIDAVVLSHAHIDHSGYIPRLVKDGYKGPIYCTEPTKDLCAILLPDSGHIQEDDARLANKFGYSKHEKALPLYSENLAKNALKQFKELPLGERVFILEDISVRFNRTGHILGSASIKIDDGQKTIVFTGDVGRLHSPVLKPPVHIDHMDALVIEATYGNRLHDDVDPLAELKQIINKVWSRNGKLLIPSFAVGRAQTVLYYLQKLKETKQIPNIPIYLDSPMSVNATELLRKYKKEHKLTDDECEKVCDVARYVRSAQESEEIGNREESSIIISASGMATGGRVLHHLQNILPNKKNVVLFVGFQAAGTRGDRLTRGEKEIKIYGELIPVNCEVKNLISLSSHADYKELIEWLRPMSKPPAQVFITHGEPEATEGFQKHLKEAFGWKAVVPDYLDSFNI